ncbi:hypothetical protein K492DRAFT_141418 [Lichtheimia hyalospora FSU 10163]|nr:hypothetical protein K492DRAFT_141418 [Lichtheimia hyalospora FSU 10163]
MQATQETKNSISSSVYGIQQLFRDFEKQCHILTTPATEEIHALGPVNIDQARHEFMQHINAIRSICSQFETEVLGDVVKMGAGAEPAFRKHLTHLKEQAQLESTVMRVKDILENTKETVEHAMNERETSKSKVQTRKLEKLAQSLGLMVFVDSTQKNEAGQPITTITLGGTVIVVDIDIDEEGSILKCKVTYVSEVLQSDQDDRVDQMLAENLQSQDYDRFKRNLGALALLDQLNVKYAPTDFFLIMRAMMADMKSIFDQEMLVVSNDMASVLMEGHGIPNQHFDYPGLSISYWMCKALVLGNDWDEVHGYITESKSHPSFSHASKLLISFEDSQKLNSFIPPTRNKYLLEYDESQDAVKEGENGEHLDVVLESNWPAFMQPMRFVKMLSSYPNVTPVPIRFVAKLDPPVPAANVIVRKLMVASGIADDASVHTSQDPSTITSSLENMLVDESLPLDTTTTWTSTFEDSTDQVYRWMGSSLTPGKLIRRITFNHPSQIYTILLHLRQQQMFNTLFRSVFHDKAVESNREKKHILSLDEILQESKSDDKLHIEVASIDAPSIIHLTISLPPSPQSKHLVLLSLSIEIPKSTPARPVIRLYPPSTSEHERVHQLAWNSDIFDQDKMTRVIQTGYSIPLLVRWLWNRIQQQPDVDYTIEVSRLGLRRSRNEDGMSAYPSKHIKMEGQ